MKNSLRYPSACVPPSVLNNASHIDHIRDNLSYDILSVFDQSDIFQYYKKDGMAVFLWFCRNTISSWTGKIKIFHTANLIGVTDPLCVYDELFFRTHILASPIKNLGKELFGQALDFFQQRSVKTVNITPFESTGSKKFYMKMINVYADRLNDAYIYPNNDIILSLKNI